MIILETKPIVEQLVDIYEKYENWHEYKMPYNEAIDYHQFHLDKGNIEVYEENGIVLGYYQRYLTGDTCYLTNIYIVDGFRNGKVFKVLYHRFFNTMPKNITKVVGTSHSHKFGGKLFTRVITKERRDGND